MAPGLRAGVQINAAICAVGVFFIASSQLPLLNDPVAQVGHALRRNDLDDVQIDLHLGEVAEQPHTVAQQYRD